MEVMTVVSLHTHRQQHPMRIVVTRNAPVWVRSTASARPVVRALASHRRHLIAGFPLQ
jgi:hypothetical protein